MAHPKRALTLDQRDELFDKTGGCCTFCGSRLVGSSFVAAGSGAGVVGEWVADEWDPEVPADPLRHLWPVCVGCVKERGNLSPQDYVVRRWMNRQPILQKKWKLRMPPYSSGSDPAYYGGDPFSWSH